MVLLLIALAATINSASDRSVVRNVQVSGSAQIKGRVILGHAASALHWKPRSQANQREVLKIEKDGRVVLLRLTEFE